MDKKHNYKVVSGDKITNQQFNGFLQMDQTVFPSFPSHLDETNEEHKKQWEQECFEKGAVPYNDASADFWQKTYEKSKEGLHLLLDEKGKVVGSWATTRPSDEKLEQYLKDHDYLQLDNDINNENEYIFSLALAKEHRNGNAIKILGGSHAEQKLELANRNICTKRVISAAVSLDGHKSLSAMGMREITQDVLENLSLPTDSDIGLDDEGRGFHYSADNLQDYNISISTWKKQNHSNSRVIQCVLDTKNKLKQFSADIKSGKAKEDFVSLAKDKNTQRAAMLFGAEYGLGGLGVFSTMSGQGNLGWYAANIVPALIDGLAISFASAKNKQPFTKESVKTALKINGLITGVAFGIGAYLGQKTGNLDMANATMGALSGAATSAAVTFGLGSVLINRESKKAQRQDNQEKNETNCL